MPVLIDHGERRRALTDAVWRVVLRDGVSGASVRAVAREAGLSTGSVRYLYPEQDDLLRDSVRALSERVRARIAGDEPARRRLVSAGRTDEAVVRLLQQVIPLNDEQVTEARIWWSFVGHDARDQAVTAMRRELDDEVRQLCQHAIMSLQDTGVIGRGRDPNREATALWVLVDGLTVRRLLDPDTLSSRAAVQTLRTYVQQLAWPEPAA